MHNQPKFVPQRGTDFFADGRSNRMQVDHTVARGQAAQADFLHTGLQDGKEVDALPFPATLAVLERGQEKYNVYCTPCHSRVGNGAGMIVQRGYKPAGNFHDAKRLAQPVSHYFYVITNGYGAMPDYSAQVGVADRWAIAAYIRALQLSQNAHQADLPAGTHVQQLTEVADQQGLPASYAGPWDLPQTAVYANQPATANNTSPGLVPDESPSTTPLSSTRQDMRLPNGDPNSATANPMKYQPKGSKPASAGQPLPR